jgi:hypothetical protein
MRNLIFSFIRRKASDIKDEVKPRHNNSAISTIEEVNKEEFSAVAGGPEVDNDPQR